MSFSVSVSQYLPETNKPLTVEELDDRGCEPPFELVVMIVLGDLIQQGVTQNDFSLTGALLAISTFAFLAILMSWLTYLSPRAEKLLDGEPRVVIRDGVLIKDYLRRDRMTQREVESEMRLAGIAQMDQVAWAILEPQGKINSSRRTTKATSGFGLKLPLARCRHFDYVAGDGDCHWRLCAHLTID